VSYSISVSIDREVTELYPRIIFLEILHGYGFYREYLCCSPSGETEVSVFENCETATAEAVDNLRREVRKL
jgi:hypothetical protein